MITHKEEKDRLKSFWIKLLKSLKNETNILALRPKLLSIDDDYFKGDFDFIIEEEEFGTALQMIYKNAKESGVNFILNQKALNKKLFKFFITDIEGTCLTVEFWTAVEYAENKYKKAFLVNSIFRMIDVDKISSTEVLIYIYITHLYYKNKDVFSQENQYRFTVFIEEISINENSEAVKLLRDIKKKNISIKEANTIAISLLKNNGIKSSSAFVQRYKLLSKKVKNKIVNLKKVIPVVGPDGVGKGSISEASLISLHDFISFRYKQLYRLNKIYALRLLLLFSNKKEQKNKLDERIPYYIFFTSFLSFQVLRYVKRNKVILMDRYFIDYFATPIRYLKKGEKPKKLFWYRLLLFLTPVPNKMIFMGCSDLSLINRKNELPLESVKFMEHINCEFIERKKMTEILFISTENSIENSSYVMKSFLVKHVNSVTKFNKK